MSSNKEAEMSLRRYGVFGSLIVFSLFFVIGTVVPSARAQQGTVGTVNVTVVDQSGAVVSGAQLELRDLSTNTVRNAATQDAGTFTFVGLNIGTYSLTVSKSGFQKQVFDSVIVHASQTTDVKAGLQVGVPTEVVEVHESASPLIETTSNAIGAVIDLKQIEDLPLGGRDLTQLANLVPGTSSTAGGGSTWNGLPAIAQGNNIDGVIGSTSRMKFSGNAEPAAQPRIENIQEMTVQTDQMAANQGFGQASMQINFVTRRGTNAFHGRVYEDFQNSYLNSNTWYNDAIGQEKGHLEINDFGASVGGPILKDKLFFFGTFAEERQPGTRFPTATILDQNAQNGIISYTGESGALQTVNVYTLAAACNANPSCIGSNAPLPTTINPVIQSQFSSINSVLADGTVSTPDLTNPDIQQLSWAVPAPSTVYFPTIRLDYNISQNWHFDGAWNETKASGGNLNSTAFFPGSAFLGQEQTHPYTNYTAAIGLDWTIRPTLINQFRAGYLYNTSVYTSSAGYNTAPTVFWANDNLTGNNIGTTPQQYNLHTGQYYPLVNASDTVTWEHGAHNVSFGFSFYREQDHYYNPPGGIYGIQLGLAAGDPGLNAISDATLPDICNGPTCVENAVSQVQALYATLVGRISGAGSNTGGFAGNGYVKSSNQYEPTTYNLDELQKAWGLFVSDSWRFRPNLTINASFRWDFTGDDHDLTSAYQGITSNADIWGPSGLNNTFKPGVLTGNTTIGGTIAAQNHQYNPWNVSPQPSLGVAWTPGFSHGFLGKLVGGGSGTTVIRAGFSIRNFTEPYQYFWDTAADYGYGYLQQFNIQSSGLTGTGFYAPGTLALAAAGDGNASLSAAATGILPANAPCASSGNFGCAANAAGWSYVPQTFPTSTPESEFTFLAGGPSLKGFDRNIKQPYTQSWNLGIERQIGRNNAIEIRYIGNRVIHQWISLNYNEVNIFQANGSDPTFLAQFKQAQANLAANKTLPTSDPYYNTFAYNSAVPGEADTPVFDAAFAGETGSLQSQDWGYSPFITDLQQGRVGGMANDLTNGNQGAGTGKANFFCNLVGQSFAGCANVGYVGAGAGYPINYFQANPYYGNSSTFFMQAGGSSTYNALQVDFRQKQWHGMQFDANYTWSHNLGMSTPNDWQAGIAQYTLRDLNESYGPTTYDLRHVAHVSGTYDLPFGAGKQFLNHSGLLDRVVGGWTVGTVFTWQSGFPFLLDGPSLQSFKTNSTYNDSSDGGLILNGVTRSQLQNSIGVYPAAGTTHVNFFGPQFQGANIKNFVTLNTTPGTLAAPTYLYGPHFWNDDIAVTKVVPITERLRFSLQGEFLNAFNHPNFNAFNFYPNYASWNVNVQSAGFGQQPGLDASSPRAIELRANLEF
ncbi:MAG: carboxypeptidase regulatory-like domain-containing protein [Candidatus Acidiferrales bacterium]